MQPRGQRLGWIRRTGEHDECLAGWFGRRRGKGPVVGGWELAYLEFAAAREGKTTRSRNERRGVVGGRMVRLILRACGYGEEGTGEGRSLGEANDGQVSWLCAHQDGAWSSGCWRTPVDGCACE